MGSPKMKLPSIAELTSAPKQQKTEEYSPNTAHSSVSSINNSFVMKPERHSISNTPHSSLSPEILPISAKEHLAQPPAQYYSQSTHSHYSYATPSSSQASLYPGYAHSAYMPQQGHPQGHVGARFYAPQLDQSQVYTAPEVINKPMNECHRCGTTETPEWRRGPNGLRTLCNACGLYHAKLVKRKGAALAAEEVLNNKVYKGKNGRRVCVKRRTHEAQVTEIPPVQHTFTQNQYYEGLQQVPRPQHHQYQPLQYYYPHPQQVPAYGGYMPAFASYAGPETVMSSAHMAYPDAAMSATRH